MLITMLADRFDAGGVLRARGTQVDVSNDLALRWIGDGVATAVGNAREAAQGMRREVEVMQDLVSGQQLAAGAPVSGAGIDVSTSRAITAADNGLSLKATASLTLTIPAGLSPMPSFTVDCPPSGTVTVAVSGGATLNGGTASLTRTRAANPVGFVVLAHEAEAYGMSGS